MKMINAGYENYVMKDKITAVLVPDTAPTIRLVQEAAKKGMLLDATCGRKRRSVIVTKDYVITSAVLPKAILGRIEGKE